MSQSFFVRTALAAAVAIVAAAPAYAQNTTAAVGGRVLTPDGKPVVGATVVVLHRESGSSNTLTTDSEGRFSARGLRVGGPYTVTVSKGGDKSVNDEVYLALAETTMVDMRLGKVDTQLEQVVVTGTGGGASKFNASNIGATTAITRKELDAYASVARNLQDYARMDARVAQTDKERGEISVAGQNSRYNSITVDGVKINDTFGLESNNLPTRKQPISIDAIESVQVNVSNYDVTQQGYTGGNINAVTKSGTNEIKGSVYYVYRTDEMAGLRYNRTNDTYFRFADYKEDTKGLTIGGPIIKDKLFFFASYEDTKSGRIQPEFGPLGSALTNVGITPAAIAKAIDISKTQYGMDVGTDAVKGELHVKDGLLKLDWNISDKHRANVRYAKTEQSDTNNGSFSGGFSATGLALSSNVWQQEKTIKTAVAQLFSDWTDNLSTELKISQRDYHSEPINASNLPAVGLRFSGTPVPAGVNSGNRFLNFGTERSRHFNILDTKTSNVYAGANLVIGDHEMKFGVDYERNKVFNAFFQDTKGNYTFGCVDGIAYSNIPGVAPGTILNNPADSNPNKVKCAGVGGLNAAQVEAAVLENYSRGLPVSYQVQLPLSPHTTLDDGVARFTMANAGLFAQDTWTISKKLTVMAGLRYDRLSLSDKPAANAAAAMPLLAGAGGTTNAAVNANRNKGGFGLDNTVVPDGADLIQPRLGFNYAFDAVEKRKSQVRGGLGLFQGAAANVWISNAYSNPGVFSAFVGCGNAGQNNCTTGMVGLFNPDPTKQPTLAGTTPAPNVDYLATGLKQPSVWKFNLAYETELPMGFTAGAEWLYTGVKDGIYYKNLNLGASTKTGPDGRELYYTPGAYDPGCWSGNTLSTSGTAPSGVSCAGNRNRALSNISFNNVLMATPTSKGGGNTLTLSIGQPKLGDFAWQAAYSRASATEVSPLTSSVSNSNFNARSVFNANADETGNSAYLVRDRISANLRWSKAFFGNNKTTVGVFYEGRKGKPYSWTYGNDMNGDGVSGNDLMYVPKDASDVVIKSRVNGVTDAQAATFFWSVVDGNQELRNAKGSVVKRNGTLSPFVNSFDLRFTQEFNGFRSGDKATLGFDLLNFGNLLNRKWGRIDEMSFQSAGGQRRTFASFGGISPDGKYVYTVGNSVDDFTTRQASGESQWAAQVTLRYSF